MNHLLFADDTLFFCKTNKQSVATLQNILLRYEQASGQKINQAKSAITFSNKAPQSLKDRVKLSLAITNEGGKGKYLGLPEHFGRKKRDTFIVIVDKIRQRAISWSSKQLSSAGKLTLLKSVLSAMPNHTMTCFKLPVSLCKRIQSVLTRFYWDAKPDERRMAWVSWKTMTRAKKDGGLGFRDIQCFNDAMLAKTSWKILTSPDCLLARVLKGKYFPNSDFLHASPPSSCSHGWRGLLIGRDLLKNHTGWAIGDGQEANIWNEPWLSTSEWEAPIGPPTRDSEFVKVASLFLPNEKDWDSGKVQLLLPHLHDKILSIKTSKQGGQGKRIWLKKSSGIYSSKTGYYAALEAKRLQEGTPQIEDRTWLSDVWKLTIPPKDKDVPLEI